MDEDASLDDFLGGESSEQSEATETAASGDTETAAGDIEPATATYAWSDEGTVCDDCGETVKRRWQQDGDLVCLGCKDWERA